MFINRRLYRFEPDILPKGVLTLADVTHKAIKTKNSRHADNIIETMTGLKRIRRYYDEFESLEERYRLGGEPDNPRWVEFNAVSC